MTRPASNQPGDGDGRQNLEVHAYAGTAGHSTWFSDDLGDSWVHPNSHSGMYLETRVWCFSAHRLRPDTLLAGADDGIYRWDERTARWTLSNAGIRDVWALAQSPDDPDVLLAGTRPAALYRSTDGGGEWTELGIPGIAKFSDINMGPTRVTRILFDPFDRSTIWAAIEIGGIYRSTDGGSTWKMLTQGLVSGDVHGVAVTRTRQGRKRILATTNRGLHISDDNGETWRPFELDSPWQYTRGVIVSEEDPSVVYLANGNGPPGNDGRLYRSPDGGDTWERLNLPGELNSTVWDVATHASDPRLLFTYTNLGQVFRSEDGGDTWVRLPQEFGELRALYWRAIPLGTRQAAHSLTRRIEPKAR